MSERTWLLTDRKSETYIENIALGPDDFPELAGDWSVVKRRLRGGLSDGVDVIEVRHEALRLVVIPTRGMGLWRAWSGGTEFGWRSPVAGPVHPRHVPVAEPSGLGWLDGFDELLCRCGLISNGAPDFDPDTKRLTHSLHGRIANLPAHRVAVTANSDTGEIRVCGVVDEARFLFHNLQLTSAIATRVGEAKLSIHDTVANRGGRPAEGQLLYHINFGAPLLGEGAVVTAPTELVVPRNAHAAAGMSSWARYLGPTPGYAEQVHFHRLRCDADGETRAMLSNAQGDLGASVVYNARELPCFIVWKNTAAEADGYVTGLEPAANFPNPRSFEQARGRTIKLSAGGSAEFHVALEFHTSRECVADSAARIRELAGGVKPVMHEQPLADWCS